MLKLGGVKILTHSDLRRHFSFPAVVADTENFLQFADFVERPQSSGLLCGEIARCLGDPEGQALSLEDFPWGISFSPVATGYWERTAGSRDVLAEHIARQNWSRAKQHSVLFVIVAVHLLAGVDPKDSEALVSPFVDLPDTAKRREGDGTVRLHWEGAAATVSPLPEDGVLVEGLYYVRPYGFDGGSSPSTIREYRNIVPSMGNARILVLPAAGSRPLGMFSLAYGQSLQLLMNGGRLVAVVPGLAAGQRHCIARSMTAEGPVFLRCPAEAARQGDVDFAYDVAATKGILQFSSDGGRGFAGVAQGRPRLFSDEDLTGLEDMEGPLVAVHVDGDLFIALDASGRIHTNHAYASGWGPMAWIGEFRDGAAYGITRDGQLAATDPALARHINQRAGGRRAMDASLWGESFFVRYTDGSLETNCDLPVGHQRIQQARCTHNGPLVLSVDSELFWCGRLLTEGVQEAVCGDRYVAVRSASGQLGFYEDSGRLLRTVDPAKIGPAPHSKESL